MRGVRFTIAEVKCITDAMTPIGSKASESVLNKLQAASAPAAVGADAGALERSLIDSSRGQVVKMTHGLAYSRASQLATKLEVTDAQMQMMGQWLFRQKWLTDATTLLGVLSKWIEWWPRAQASAPPAGVPAGLNGAKSGGDVRQGAQASGRTPAQRRPAPGFR